MWKSLNRDSVAEFALVFLSMYVVYYSVSMLMGVGDQTSASYFISFFGRKVYPILLIIGFLTLRCYSNSCSTNNILNRVSQATVIFTIEILVILLFGLISGVTFETFTDGGNWSYIACFEYGIALVSAFFLFGKKIGYNFQNFMLVSLALLSAGTIYELPVIFRAGEYMLLSHFHTLFIEPGIIGTILLCYMLYTNKFRFKKIHFITLTFFLSYSIIIFLGALNPNYLPFAFPMLEVNDNLLQIHLLLGWLPRIPAMLFTLSLLFGYNKP